MDVSPPQGPVALVAALGLITLTGSASPARVSGAPTLQQLIGQKLVVRMGGTTPSRSLLARARAGQIGGVVVHRSNFNPATGLAPSRESFNAPRPPAGSLRS